MGKNRILGALGNRIGNVVVHKMLAKYTNRPESIEHLRKEEDEYRKGVVKESKKYHWNEKEKEELKYIAIKFFINRNVAKYKEILFPQKEVEDCIDEEIKKLEL